MLAKRTLPSLIKVNELVSETLAKVTKLPMTSVMAGTAPLYGVMLYPVIGECPVLAGAAYDTTAEAAPGDAFTAVGAPGAVRAAKLSGWMKYVAAVSSPARR